ncbi:MAG: hypothetical protein AVDCRST_MAG18-2898 [uncultured Thermomicrobiales bacterium]|uniref:Ribbon-helix-helix protein CopG domain-containing protein n=1 Tax=uncultured Thermomicrobiales bacterium TaxID=1645740 RepID=A0A6J4VKR8_9BACT|nr:MAG: hypothetical protein AVDCRST_MAG18-2898 [uncultured Thermomicrobiales bacterium]
METTRLRNGQPLTAEASDALVQEAETGFAPEQIRPRTADRPPLGYGTSFRVQFRVSSATFEALLARTRSENRGVSEIARLALERYLCDDTIPTNGIDDRLISMPNHPDGTE